MQRSLGVAPDMTKAMANSPAVLKGCLNLNGALSAGVLDAASREHIAPAVAQDDACSYCLSAHSYLAEHVAHLSADDITADRTSTAPTPRPPPCAGPVPARPRRGRR